VNGNARLYRVGKQTVLLMAGFDCFNQYKERVSASLNVMKIHFWETLLTYNDSAL